MTIKELMELENKLLIIDKYKKDNLSFSGQIILHELLEKIGWITNLAIVLAGQKKISDDFSEIINSSDIDYIFGKYKDLNSYKEIEKLF